MRLYAFRWTIDRPVTYLIVGSSEIETEVFDILERGVAMGPETYHGRFDYFPYACTYYQPNCYTKIEIMK